VLNAEPDDSPVERVYLRAPPRVQVLQGGGEMARGNGDELVEKFVKIIARGRPVSIVAGRLHDREDLRDDHFHNPPGTTPGRELAVGDAKDRT